MSIEKAIEDFAKEKGAKVKSINFISSNKEMHVWQCECKGCKDFWSNVY